MNFKTYDQFIFETAKENSHFVQFITELDKNLREKINLSVLSSDRYPGGRFGKELRFGFSKPGAEAMMSIERLNAWYIDNLYNGKTTEFRILVNPLDTFDPRWNFAIHYELQGSTFIPVKFGKNSNDESRLSASERNEVLELLGSEMMNAQISLKRDTQPRSNAARSIKDQLVSIVEDLPILDMKDYRGSLIGSKVGITESSQSTHPTNLEDSKRIQKFLVDSVNGTVSVSIADNDIGTSFAGGIMINVEFESGLDADFLIRPEYEDEEPEIAMRLIGDSEIIFEDDYWYSHENPEEAVTNFLVRCIKEKYMTRTDFTQNFQRFLSSKSLGIL